MTSCNTPRGVNPMAKTFGGSAWESNPPRTFLPVTGFEVQEAHQNLSTSNLQIN